MAPSAIDRPGGAFDKAVSSQLPRLHEIRKTGPGCLRVPRRAGLDGVESCSHYAWATAFSLAPKQGDTTEYGCDNLKNVPVRSGIMKRCGSCARVISSWLRMSAVYGETPWAPHWRGSGICQMLVKDGFGIKFFQASGYGYNCSGALGYGPALMAEPVPSTKEFRGQEHTVAMCRRPRQQEGGEITVSSSKDTTTRERARASTRPG